MSYDPNNIWQSDFLFPSLLIILHSTETDVVEFLSEIITFCLLCLCDANCDQNKIHREIMTKLQSQMQF